MVDEIDFQPAAEYIIDDLETLKVLADPLRLSIVECLTDGPATVKQIAERIDKPPTKLYYHFNLLEKHSLIKMVYTRIVSGIVEKHYQVAAKTYRVERGLLSPSLENFDENLDAMLSGIISEMRADIRDSLMKGLARTDDDAPQYRRLLLTQGRLKLNPEQAEDFYTRLLALLDEFGELNLDQDADDLITYKLTLALHPGSRSKPKADS